VPFYPAHPLFYVSFSLGYSRILNGLTKVSLLTNFRQIAEPPKKSVPLWMRFHRRPQNNTKR
jgi:hypothetical protein